ncbi:MAG TPA: hypothetical protein PLO62_10195 [Candidatus Hydrogenedentes bacterium]|nr:hypothetical protein [Candidatus Hydrogenedentota bacterium]
MLARQMETLQETLDELGQAVDALLKKLADGREQKDQILQDHWRTQKTAKTLERLGEDYDKILESNQHLLEERVAIRERLQHILALTRTLASEYGP